MMMRLMGKNRGFSLIELIVIIVVLGILAAVAMQSMSASVEDIRHIETEREMDMLAEAIVGNPSLYSGGSRSDFGYVGDIGSFPPNLQALADNPGGYATWNGPYLPSGFIQDTVSYRLDAWGQPYQYAGGLVITSNGSGSPITKKIANAAADYLANTMYGVVVDANDSVPGLIYMDSVDVAMSIPDGIGGTTIRMTTPDSAGNFMLSALPAGIHPLSAIYRPAADTLLRYVTILPRHRSDPPSRLRFAGAYFSAGSPCSSPDTLRPTGPGSLTELTTDGCAANWQCVADAVPDDDATYVETTAFAYMTDLYQLAAPVDTACTITAITVHIRAREFVKVAYAKAVLMTQGNIYEGSEETLALDYADYSMRWTNNPATGLPWTWGDIADMEIGVALMATKATHAPRCTQVFVVVERTP